MPDPDQDLWSAWVLDRSHGGDPDEARQRDAFLAGIRDRVLAGAAIRHGDVVLDVGTGDGLLGVGALRQVGATGRVIFTDISERLLDRCRERAEGAGALDRCSFGLMSAERLDGVEEGSVDVVTTRSVLIFVADKAAAFRSFHRVLRPGGRLSIFEPINRFRYPEPSGTFSGYDVTPVADLADRVAAVYRRAQPPDTDPMLDFDERDLVALATLAGFAEVHLRLDVDIEPAMDPHTWDVYLDTAPNPRAPTPREAIAGALQPEEAERLAAHLRPLVESGNGRLRSSVAYVSAVKP